MNFSYHMRTVFTAFEARIDVTKLFRKITRNKIEFKMIREESTTSSDGNKYKDYVKFMELVGKLKHIKRTGWMLRDVKDCESIAGHMYRMSMMTFLLPENTGLDRIKCMEIALVHDLAEASVGDITPYCGISREEKLRREFDAMKDISKLAHASSDKLMTLFEEYEKGETAEAKFVKDLDRLDLIMQAFEYEKRDENPERLQEFFDNTEGKFQHPFIKKIVDEIYAQRLMHQKKDVKEEQSS
uniref:5'-deoxynucleotidase HDDC2 n=1 Tax=Culicoides sonorensis TaxID=179676 RepID=A0A336LMJ8_CULSO